jgi:dimethylamine monooxygenase subunit A
MQATSPDWIRLFPDEDFQFHFGVHRAPPEHFFNPTTQRPTLLQERADWLSATPDRYSALLPEGIPLLIETVTLARSWNPQSFKTEGIPSSAKCDDLGKIWESDFVLLKPNAGGVFELVGGCVCFPSSWRLTDKLGRPLNEIHQPVPGLNESLGPPIDRFLSKLKPGSAALRSNWGLSRSNELNQHPDRRLPALEPPLKAEEIFIRIENQALVALPESGGILFGIRLEIVPFTELLGFPTAANGLRRALQTMPAEVADYKNLTTARSVLLELLA